MFAPSPRPAAAEDPLRALSIPASTRLGELLAAFEAGAITEVKADLRAACGVVRARPPGMLDHGPVLGVSIGGSTSGAMLVSFERGRPRVLDAVRMPNPVASTSFADFLDALLIVRPAIRDHLRGGSPQVGMAVAVPFDDGVPFHASKLPTIDGLVARDRAAERRTRHLPTTFANWCASRGLGRARFHAEGDAPLAHLGGLAGAPPRAGESSLLLVCGTGLGLADDRRFILPSLLPVLGGHDPELFPDDLTEGGQLQYLCAGKGIHKVLRNALVLRARRTADPLHGHPPPTWFLGDSPARHVYAIGLSRLQGWTPDNPALASLREDLPPDAWDALGETAGRVVGAALDTLAAAVVATLVRDPARAHLTAVVYREGSIACDPVVAAEVERRCDGLLHGLAEERHGALPARILWRSIAECGAVGTTPVPDFTLLGAATLATTAGFLRQG